MKRLALYVVLGFVLVAGVALGDAMMGKDPSGQQRQVSNVPQTFLDATAANCAGITAASQQYTVTAGQFYSVCTYGNSAYLLGGASPTATTTVTTGYSFIVPEGTCTEKFKPTSAKLAWIGASAAGVICFKAYTSP